MFSSRICKSNPGFCAYKFYHQQAELPNSVQALAVCNSVSCNAKKQQTVQTAFRILITEVLEPRFWEVLGYTQILPSISDPDTVCSVFIFGVCENIKALFITTLFVFNNDLLLIF